MFNLKSIYDLPSIGRLNTVHHDGVPNSKCLDHFLFLTESTQCAMTYDGNYRIVVRGYYAEKWHSSFYTVYESPFIREILPLWYDTVACIVADQNIRHGFVDVFFDHDGLFNGSTLELSGIADQLPAPNPDWRID